MDDERQNMDQKQQARDPSEYWARIGRIVPGDGKSSALSMFPTLLKSILLQRRLTCEGFLACHRSKRVATILVLIEAMKVPQMPG